MKFARHVSAILILRINSLVRGMLRIVVREGLRMPNEATAVAIAEAVLIPIYGAAEVAADRSYRARLTDGIWRVSGTLPPDRRGGTAVAMIAKDDGRIVRVFHEQ